MDKAGRVLMLFTSLIAGKKINKADFANSYRVNGRTFDRDIEDIRNVLAEIHSGSEINFNKSENCYYMTEWNSRGGKGLTAVEAITMFKILLASQALRKDEMKEIFRSVYSLVISDERKTAINALNNDIEHYKSPAHDKAIIKMLGDLNKVIQRRIKINLRYTDNAGYSAEKIVLPLAFIFSEFYFYLIVLADDKTDNNPEFFRVDKIESFRLTDERYNEKLLEQYHIYHINNLYQLMEAGRIINIKLRCHVSIIEAIYDKFPDSKLIKDEGEWQILGIKTNEKAVPDLLFAYGKYLEILEPLELRKEMIQRLKSISKLYKIL